MYVSTTAVGMPNRPPSCSKLPIDSACHGLAHIPWRGAFVGSLPYPVPICCWDGLQCCHHHKPEQEDLCLLCLAAKFHHRLATQKQRKRNSQSVGSILVCTSAIIALLGEQKCKGHKSPKVNKPTHTGAQHPSVWHTLACGGEMCRNTSITQDCQFTWTAQMQNAFP